MSAPPRDPITAERPPATPAAALPFAPQDGVMPPGTGEWEVRAALIADSLPRTIRRVALPSVASSLLMTLFTTVDAYWVGRRVGAGGLAAVSTSVFWVWLVVSVAEMVSVGLTAVASRRHGEGRHDEAARTVGDAICLALALGVVISLAGVLALDRLFAVMHTPPDVTALGHDYLRAYLIGTPLIFGYFAVDAGFRAAGDTRTPLALLATSVAVTLVLDPVLIAGLGSAPRLGVEGAAIATVGTRGAAFLMGLALLARRRAVRFGAPRAAALGAIARVGLPTAVTGVLFSLIYVLLTRTTTRFGTPALAALGLGHRVESWLYMIGVGFAGATAAVVGQNLGAGQAERAARAGWVATGYATLPAVFFVSVSVLFPARVAGFFTTDPAVVADAASYLRIAAISQLFVCSEIVLEGALGGAGHTLPPMLSSTLLTASRVPLAAWAAPRLGLAGVWWTISLTAVARGVAMMALWRQGGWRRKSV